MRWIAAAAAAAAGLLAFAPAAASEGPRRPDLVVGSLSEPPQQARPGDRLTAWDVTANHGRRRAAASETSSALGPHGPLAARPVPALRKRAQSRGELVIAIPAEIPDGEYALIACADATDRVRERDERNNCTSSAGVVVIDTVAPAAPSIDERPESVTEGERARVAFSAAEPDIAFVCALDGAAPASCSSPLELTGLESGDHTLRVSRA